MLVPTPYSIKLALISAVIETNSVSEGEDLFEMLKGRPCRICPPTDALVSSGFLKVWKLARPAEDDEEVDINPQAKTFAPSVGFREYVNFWGEGTGALFQIAIAASNLKQSERALIAKAALATDYSGKRGSFFQFVPANTEDGLVDFDELSVQSPFTLPSSIWRTSGMGVPLGTVQILDELPMSAIWNNVSSYGSGKMKAFLESQFDAAEFGTKIHADRIFIQTFVPYRLTGSSRGYAHYRRVDVST